MNGRRMLEGLTLVLLAAAGAARAQAPEQAQALLVTADNLMAGDPRHQAWAAAGGAATDVLPGDVIRYTLRFTNRQDAPVRNVVFANPIPSGLRYVAASAAATAADAVVTYSIDGGKSYSAQPMIEVVENGERRSVPAPSQMYTHVRWTLAGWVQPGAQVTAEFRAELPTGERRAEQR